MPTIAPHLGHFGLAVRSARRGRSPGRPLAPNTPDHRRGSAWTPASTSGARWIVGHLAQRSSNSSADPACARCPMTCSSSHTARARSTQTQRRRSPGFAHCDGDLGRFDLVQHTSICLTRPPLAWPCRAPCDDQFGGLAPHPTAEPLVLPDDDPVEVLGRLQAQVDHVLVPAVTGGGDDADPLRPLQRTRCPRRTGRRSRQARPWPARCGSSRRSP